jgi:hypothetical protein
MRLENKASQVFTLATNTRGALTVKRIFNLLAFAMAVVAVTITPLNSLAQKPGRLIDRASDPRQKNYDLVVSLPVGDGGVHYENVGVPETEVTGPTSFRIDANGNFVVADSSTNRILTVSVAGVVERDIKIPDARGIVDMAVGQNGDIFALDLAQQTIYRLKAGRVVQKTNLPADFRLNGLTGIAVDQESQPVLELKGGSKLAKPNGEETRTQTIHGKDVSLTAPDLGSSQSDESSGKMIIGDNQIPIQVPNTLAGLQLVGVDKSGGVFVSVVEMVSYPAIRVDETIRHYDNNLDLLGIARVPLAERFAYTQRGVGVDQDGNVYAMIPREDRLDIVRLSFKKALKPILQSTELKESEPGILHAHASRLPVMVPSACSRTRTQMTAAAAEYPNNQTYLTSTNLSGTCAGRTAPRYLGTNAGNKVSVPYDWGGFDSVSDYRSFMSQVYKAGDINTAGVESCSKGVDCSGFVSRVWGLTSKYSTTTLPGISTQLLDVKSLQMGDIVNLYNSHVVIFNGMENGGIDAWESTVYGSQDRVVYGYVSWTRLSGYVPYRYNGVCNTGTVSLSVTPTNISVARGSTASFTVYGFTSDGFRGSVNLYALNLPGTVLAGTGFYPQTINVNSNSTWFGSTLKIVTNSATPRGSRVITIEGRSGDRILRAYVQLNIL